MKKLLYLPLVLAFSLAAFGQASNMTVLPAFGGGGSGTGTITGVVGTAGGGLIGGGFSGNVSLGLMGCAATQILQYSGTTWLCANLPGGSGTISGVTAGPGLTGGGTSGAITIGIRTDCGNGQVLQFNGTTWPCATIAGTGTVTNTAGSLTSGLGLIGNGGADAKADVNFDDGVTTANTFTIKTSAGLAVNSGGLVNLFSLKDSAGNCPATITSGYSGICSASFIPQWITNNSGTPATTVLETQNNKAVAGGYASLDGSAFVPAAQLNNFPAAVNVITGNTSLSITPSATTWTMADYGASPTQPYVITDNATTSTDNSPDLYVNTGASSFHRAVDFGIRGVDQFQICEQTGPQGETVVGSAVTCANIGTSTFAKFVAMSNTATHIVARLYQNSTSASAPEFEINNATAAGTGWFGFKLCAGATGSNTGCGSGTIVASLRGDGLFTGSGVSINGATSGSALLSVSNTGGTLNLGSTNATVTSAGALTVTSCAGCAGTASWSSLAAGAGSLALGLSGSSIFSATTAVSQYFAWKNTTAALVGASQSSPNIALCGTEWHSSASTEGCLNLQFVPGTGTDAANTFAFTHTGSATGITTTSFPGPMASGSDGVHAAYISLLGNTTAPSITANTVGWLGPNSASFSAYGLQLPTTNPSGNFLQCGTPSSGVSACSWTTTPSSALSSITTATASNTIANGNNGLQIWNWAPTTNQNQFQFGETTAATSGTLGNQYILSAKTLAGSTAVPFGVIGSLTGSQTLPTLHITPTWNTSGVVDAALLINATNTASGTGSLLADFQIGSTSQWKVDKTGQTTQLGNINAPAYVSTGTTAAFVDYPQGTTSAAVAPCNTANSICEQAPTSVTSYLITKAGTGPANNSMGRSYTALSSSATTESFVQIQQKAMLTSAYTNATTGATNVTGLSFALDASTSYTGACHLIYKAASTGGLAIDFTGPASPTLVTYGLNYFTSATAGNSAATTGAVFSTSVGGTAVATATTDFTADITFGITNGTTAGTLQLQAKSSAAVTLTIEAGSFCQMQ